MGTARIGGGEAAYIFNIKTDHSGFVKADGTTPAATMTDAILKLGGDASGEHINTEYTITPNEDGSVNVKLVSLQYNGSVKTFKDTFLNRKKTATSAGKPEKKSVGGRAIGGSTSSSNKDSYLILYAGSDETDIPVFGYVVKWKNESLGLSIKGGEYNEITLEGVAQPATAALTLPVAFFDSALVDVAAAQTHAKDSYEFEAHLPVAS